MWTLLAVVVPLRGCSIEPEPSHNALGQWTGRFTSDDGCSDGRVELSTVQHEDGSWTANWDYRSERPSDPDDGAHARYALSGDGTSAHLSMSTVDRQADPLVDGVWCNGDFTFDLQPAQGVMGRLAYRALGWAPPPETLHGTWVATDCSCTGTIEMTRKMEFIYFTF